MTYEIVIPFANEADDKKIVACCKRHGVEAVKASIRGQKVYKLSTNDISNFYWLGANIQNSIV